MNRGSRITGQVYSWLMKAIARVVGIVAALVLPLVGCTPSTSQSPPVIAPTAEVSAEPTSEPLVAEAEARTAREITYDHHLIPSAAEPFFDEELRAYYEQLVDAVIAREPSFPMPDGVYARPDSWRAVALFQGSNPLGGLVAPSNSPDGSTQFLDYYYNEAEHARMVESIAPHIERLVAELIPEQANDLDAALAVYEYLSLTTTYSQEGSLTGSYGVLIDSTGMCVGFATGMVWLLEQAGISNSHSVSWFPDDPNVEGHTWTVSTFDSANYHVDPTWENGETAGFGLRYFGMTEEERLAPGTLGPFQMDWLDDVVENPTATDERFAPLRDAVAYSLDPVVHLVEAQMPDGETIVFSTETLSVVD